MCNKWGNVFLKDYQSITHLVELFSRSPGVQLAVCGVKCIDICNEAIKILGTYFHITTQ